MFVYKQFEIPLYGNEYTKLHLVLSDKKNWPKVTSTMEEWHDGDVNVSPYDDVKALAMTTYSDKKGFNLWMIFCPDGLTPEVITHEVIHFKNYVFKSRGIKPDVENDEPEAYFVGWANKVTFDTFKKYLKFDIPKSK